MDSTRPKVGVKIQTWFGPATILKVERYRGAYPQWFNWIIRVSSETSRGWTEMAIKDMESLTKGRGV